jgi:hypothetical protein
MNQIEHGTLLITGILELGVENLGFVQELVVEAKDALVLGVGLVSWWSGGSHITKVKQK